MKSDEIRKAFLNYFRQKKHDIVPSSSLVPRGDPTLLLTTAGMVQFKPYFLGTTVPPNRRLASCQKCFRTTDIDSVGDTKHLTFFEMLGNFSVGDYFKEEAIAWGLEFVTKNLKITPERLWVTVFHDDEEAYNIWRKIGFPEEKILRFGEKDNFWGPAGNSGSCGPCSEIHFDFGSDIGCRSEGCNPGCGCGRFMEIWNLVFTEYNRDINGKKMPLPKPNIDTGMGLERMTAVMQNVKSVYDTDLFKPVIGRVSEMSDKSYGADEEIDNTIRIVAEHSRGIAFLIADGVLPANDGRGYVLRRILRRASFFGKKLGLDKPFLSDVIQIVINKMGQIYPELIANEAFIKDLVTTEEEKFDNTLDIGLNLVNKLIAEALEGHKKELSGIDVFQLYDTYGFLPELTAEIAVKSGFRIDMEGFKKEMESQRERGRSKQKFAEFGIGVILAPSVHLKAPKFEGYEKLFLRTKIIQIKDLKKDQILERAGKESKVSISLELTPFYGEMGGQVGDTGEIVTGSGRVIVTNTLGGTNEIIGEITEGEIILGEVAEAKVNQERRFDIARNHTATHLLQTALRNILGTHVFQRGSFVGPEGLRFDFSHLKEINTDELTRIESFVNEKVRQNLPVQSKLQLYTEAIASGAIALFEEKYGEQVRVLRIGEPAISTELCGGTHVMATGEIGFFLIMSEGSIGTGLRRIEAVTGREAEKVIRLRLNHLTETAKLLNVPISEVTGKSRSFLEEIKVKNKTIASLEKQELKNWVEDIIKHRVNVNGVSIIAEKVSPVSADNLRELGDMIRNRLQSSVIVLGTYYDDRVNFIAMVTSDLVEKGLNAGKIVKQVAAIAGGSGGGRADIAQAGAKDAEKISEALEAVEDIIIKMQQR